jgi:hypothetical protein
MTDLSGTAQIDDLVVVFAVLSGRDGQHDAVQVLVAETSIAGAVQRLREAGYRNVRSRAGSMRVDNADAAVAAARPGVVFERGWLHRGAWAAIS